MKFFGIGKNKEEESLKNRGTKDDNPMNRSTIKVGEIEN
jgi:hypothetical protein